MEEAAVRQAAQTVSNDVLLAWLIATQPEIDLADPRAMPKAFVPLAVPDVIPEAMHDVFRTHMRDAAARVLNLAAIMRSSLGG